MRKHSTLFTLGLTLAAALPFSAAQGQTLEPRQALLKAQTTQARWAATGYAAADMRLSSAYADASGLEHVYVQQLHRGIPVYNQVVSLAFQRSQLANHAGTFRPAKALAKLTATPTITAASALQRAVQHLNPNSSLGGGAVPLETQAGPEARQTFAANGIARHNMVVSLVWAFDQNNQPHLAWNVNVDLLGTPDWWNVQVDALKGTILNQDSWTVEETASAHPEARTAHTAQAAPMTFPTAQQAFATAFLPPTTTSSSYLVVAFPGAAPGSQGLQTETDPWLKAGAANNATTHGWHFDGTANYNTTRGNNVAAYDDSLKLNAPGRYAFSQTTGSALSFLYTPNFTQTPTTSNNRKAATVNLFYWSNLVHDLTYQYGFTETAGNYQSDNIGRGGAGNDHVLAEAQDGNGVNNANFSAPPDGTSGRMQMFLWNAAPQPLQVTAPTTIAGTYPMSESAFSTNNKLATLGPVSGQVALYKDAGTSPVTSLACVNHDGPALTGKIVLIYRGVCSFAPKVKLAQTQGAAAVIVVNNAPGAPTAMGGTDNTITIPAVMVSQETGALLAAQLNNNVPVTVTLPRQNGVQLDGDFDNGIIAHEYGHGVSIRLTGGPANSSCLSNAEQGGEGWSDYLALMMTTDWATTPLTAGASPRPIGTYADGGSTKGIRRYPYSTSLSVSPLTYADVTANPAVHAIGEIWCATIWDMTWNIIQQAGTIEPNIYNSTSNGGNTVAMNLVMQGMKLQPCQPGFLDARDAILAADSLLYNGRYHCTIWSAFARRGMGYSAVQGFSTNATDQTAAFDMPPAVTLLRTTPVLAGNTIDVSLSLKCNCQVPTTGYTLTDQLPTGMQFVSSADGATASGNTVSFRNINFTSSGEVKNLTFRAQTAANAGCAVVLPVNDNREASTLGGFTNQVISGTANWTASTTLAYSPGSAWYAPDASTPTDFTLTSAAFTPQGLSTLSFYHYYDLEGGYDGGTVELSTNGTTWTDAASLFVENGYNSAFQAGSPAPGQRCFSSQSVAGVPSFIRSTLDLRSFNGVPVRVRFRMRSDTDNPNPFRGWFIDDIKVSNGCGGNQIVELRDGGNTLRGTQSIVTYLLPGTITANKSALTATPIYAQPNPFGKQGLQLVLPVGQGQVALHLYDVAGRAVLHRTAAHPAGSNPLLWPEAAKLPAGLYLLRVQLADGSNQLLRVIREE